MNNANITGNLTRDTELKSLNNGTAVCSFTVAVNERKKNQQGEWEDYPNFIDCTLFGVRAEKLAQYLTKGTKVAVAGRLHQSRWQDDKGNNRSRIEILVDEIELMSRGNAQPSQQPSQQEFNSTDIPF